MVLVPELHQLLRLLGDEPEATEIRAALDTLGPRSPRDEWAALYRQAVILAERVGETRTRAVSPVDLQSAEESLSRLQRSTRDIAVEWKSRLSRMRAELERQLQPQVERLKLAESFTGGEVCFEIAEDSRLAWQVLLHVVATSGGDADDPNYGWVKKVRTKMPEQLLALAELGIVQAAVSPNARAIPPFPPAKDPEPPVLRKVQRHERWPGYLHAMRMPAVMGASVFALLRSGLGEWSAGLALPVGAAVLLVAHRDVRTLRAKTRREAAAKLHEEIWGDSRAYLVRVEQWLSARIDEHTRALAETYEGWRKEIRSSSRADPRVERLHTKILPALRRKLEELEAGGPLDADA